MFVLQIVRDTCCPTNKYHFLTFYKAYLNIMVLELCTQEIIKTNHVQLKIKNIMAMFYSECVLKVRDSGNFSSFCAPNIPIVLLPIVEFCLDN